MARPKRKALTQADVITAAVQLLNTEGELALGINRVAKALGIQPPSMYNHVSGNDDLRRLVALEGWRQLRAIRDRTAADAQDSRQLLRAVAIAMRELAHHQPELYGIASNYRFEADDPDFAPIFQDVLAFYTQALAPLGLGADDIVHAKRMLQATFHGYAHIERVGMRLMPQTADETYEWMLDTLIEALRHRAQST